MMQIYLVFVHEKRFDETFSGEYDFMTSFINTMMKHKETLFLIFLISLFWLEANDFTIL